jgi:hypothetical protein
VDELGYSEAQAAERISAMRLMTQVEDVKEKMKDGSLTLTTAAKIQRFLKNEKKVANKVFTPEEKGELIQSCEKQSKRAVERILLERSVVPATMAQERERLITPTSVELKLTIPTEVMKQMEEIRNLSGREVTLAEIFTQGAESYLKNLLKKNQSLRVQAQNSTRPAESRYVPKSIRAEITERSPSSKIAQSFAPHITG